MKKLKNFLNLSNLAAAVGLVLMFWDSILGVEILIIAEIVAAVIYLVMAAISMRKRQEYPFWKNAFLGYFCGVVAIFCIRVFKPLIAIDDIFLILFSVLCIGSLFGFINAWFRKKP